MLCTHPPFCYNNCNIQGRNSNPAAWEWIDIPLRPGCQYTSLAFRKLLLEHEIVQSFSRAGTPYDNGAMESFFSSLKQEEIYRTSYTSEKDFKRKIAEYMVFYNERRPHRANNYKTPDQKELAFWEKNKNRCPNKTGSDVVTDYVQTPIWWFFILGVQ